MKKSFWIKERHNPQSGVYYAAMGPMWKKEAKEYGKTLYGHNVMHEYKTEEEYINRITDLRASGETVICS